MKTAVEWLWLNLTDDLIGDLAPEKILKIHELIEQAKAMEKEQIIDAFYNGDISIWNENSEQYYNETFKKK